MEEALGELTHYYRTNSLHTNPKMPVIAFHLRTREARRSLKIIWNSTNTAHLKYLGVTIDRTISYKEHIQNTKMKVATCNNHLWKLANSKWETNTSTIITTALALCYLVAKYAASVLMTVHGSCGKRLKTGYTCTICKEGKALRPEHTCYSELSSHNLALLKTSTSSTILPSSVWINDDDADW